MPIARRPLLTMLAAVAASLAAAPAPAYFTNASWSATATDGPTGPAGDPITLTWGLSADGTTVPNVLPGVNRSSDLVASLDGWYGDGGGGPDLTARPWFGYLQSAFDAWSSVSGLTFVYEPADDGATHGLSPGVLGVRADVRLAGGRYDGTVGSNTGTLGYSIAPDNADIFLDTDDVAYFSDPSGEAFRLRHTLMHEIGHSLGLGHVTSNDSDILLEPFPQTGFDGPQLDDIRGVQSLYGDPLEVGAGNNTAATATPLGALDLGETVTIGADGGLTVFTLGVSDFVSLHRPSDIDVFSLNVGAAARVEATVTPLGFDYRQQVGGSAVTTVRSARVGDLELLARRGEILIAEADAGGFGAAETLSFVATPGDAFTLDVSGIVGSTQLYRLDVTATALGLEGDYNGDGRVDAADYVVWRATAGAGAALPAADGDGDGLVDARDFAVWAAAYGTAAPTAQAVPEPAAWLFAFAVAFFRQAVGARRRPYL